MERVTFGDICCYTVAFENGFDISFCIQNWTNCYHGDTKRSNHLVWDVMIQFVLTFTLYYLISFEDTNVIRDCI